MALVAEEAAGTRALQMLAKRRQPLAGVLSETESVVSLAAELGVPLLPSERVTEPSLAEWISEHGVDVLLNVHSVRNPHPAVLEAPRLGAYNMHPGALPRYAGFNAPSWSVAEGEDRHAVTVHRMVEEMDAGPIAYEGWFEIGPRDTGLKVATGCIKHGLPLLERLLDEAERGTVPAIEQPSEGGHFYWYEVPHDGVLPWGLGARAVVDLVRAADYAPFPSPWGTFVTTVGGQEVEIVRAARSNEATDAPAGEVGAEREAGVPVSAGDEWVLVERVRVGGEVVEPASVLVAGAVCEPAG